VPAMPPDGEYGKYGKYGDSEIDKLFPFCT
jgi:hypothetical protein